MSRKRYLFFDIDGTLLADGPLGYVPESTRRAIKKLEEAGHFVSIATGRAQFMAEPYMRMLEMENMVSDGGNGITIGGKSRWCGNARSGDSPGALPSTTAMCVWYRTSASMR